MITDDIEHVPGGKTFFWAGRYERDVNVRHTLQTDLNVFEHFEPKLSDASRAAETLFLANIQPDLQRAVREQCAVGARSRALDSMNLWIDIAHESLVATIGMVDCVILNDGEVRQLTDEPNLVRAARRLLDMGPRVVVAKQGEYGSAMFTREGVFGLPAYPTPDVVDPTGAGDTFAGGFMGYVAAHDDREITDDILRTAMAYGTAMASFNVEAFGTERMQTADRRTRSRPAWPSWSGSAASRPCRSRCAPSASAPSAAPCAPARSAGARAEATAAGRPHRRADPGAGRAAASGADADAAARAACRRRRRRPRTRAPGAPPTRPARTAPAAGS